MSQRYSRRQLLRTGVAAGTSVGLAGCGLNGPSGGQSERERQPETTEDQTETTEDRGPPVDVRGAIYLPTRAFNIFQMWWQYDPAVIERDLEYATRVNLNAIRIWTSYEWWSFDEEAHTEALNHFLTAADERGIAVLVDLFEAIGEDPTRDNRENTDPLTAVPVASPAADIVANEDRWDGPEEYVEWFMERYRDDDRLLAISVMNEPGWRKHNKRFARGMFETLVANRGSVPLTVGSTSLVNSRDYHQWGSDVLQFHFNFVRHKTRFRQLLWDANHVSAAASRPVWLTEWQRFNSTGSRDESGLRPPNYASMARSLREAGVGNFFWSLMVKPAYVRHMREYGIFSGLFHEDGTVWSLEDARAIKSMSGESDFDSEERAELPEWMRAAFGE